MSHNSKFNDVVDSSSSASWSREEDKLFESALVFFPEESPERWEKIARQVPGKSSVDVKKRYEELIRDLREIESGLVELPSYEDELGPESGASLANKSRERETERRKGTPWSAEEHLLFLMGLEKYGKGDWRSISRNAVVSRTPTQVASHAQKYFLRVNAGKKEKKRCSIHDITTADSDSLGQTSDQNWAETLHLDSAECFGRSLRGYHQDYGFPKI